MPWLFSILKSFGSWIVPFFLEYLGGKISAYFKNRKKLKEEAAKQRETATAYKEVVANPDSTREERQRAEDDYLNGVTKPKSDT